MCKGRASSFRCFVLSAFSLWQMVIDYCDQNGCGEIAMDDFCKTILQAQKLQQAKANDAAAHG